MKEDQHVKYVQKFALPYCDLVPCQFLSFINDNSNYLQCHSTFIPCFGQNDKIIYTNDVQKGFELPTFRSEV